MEITRITLPSFSVIGKEGSSKDGKNFVRKLWEATNAQFNEIEHLAKWNNQGALSGIWGLMTGFNRDYMPWDKFANGLYLAGVECVDEAAAPDGWTVWTIPSFEYVRAKINDTESFKDTIGYLIANKLNLIAAVQDYTDPKTGDNYMLFPINKPKINK